MVTIQIRYGGGAEKLPRNASRSSLCRVLAFAGRARQGSGKDQLWLHFVPCAAGRFSAKRQPCAKPFPCLPPLGMHLRGRFRFLWCAATSNGDAVPNDGQGRSPGGTPCLPSGFQNTAIDNRSLHQNVIGGFAQPFRDSPSHHVTAMLTHTIALPGFLMPTVVYGVRSHRNSGIMNFWNAPSHDCLHPHPRLRYAHTLRSTSQE